MPIGLELSKGLVPVKIYTGDVESAALDQLIQVSNLPFIHSHVAVMPDVHAGIGCTVGTVIPTKGAIIPAALGVDIGCGINALRLSVKAHQLPDSLVNIRSRIEDTIPVGFAGHTKYNRIQANAIAPLVSGFSQIAKKHPKLKTMQRDFDAAWRMQLGSLGSGNHFIELCIDENQDVWVMLHSGSRGVGNVIGRYFIELAQQDMGVHLKNLPHKDLAYLQEGTQHFEDYVEAVHWAQEYALVNRRVMMELVLESLKKELPEFHVTKEAINCHHNYVSIETHFGEQVYLTRKGAISAYQGQLGIIPGSMGAKSYIVEGKGNAESFCSCSHGAGRKMSRSKAKLQFSEADLIAQTQGVECRKDVGVLDEIPGAYKDIDKVMENQHDLVSIVHTLKQVLCVKG